jgi:hypothetical protein
MGLVCQSKKMHDKTVVLDIFFFRGRSGAHE